jgi:hypothetical protein
MKEKPKRGGKREGSGRKPMGKKTYSLTLTEGNVVEARKRESNFSGLIDRLLARWLRK